MANKTPASAQSGVSSFLTFRDTTHTSRTLILPGDRQLPVVRAQVSVSTDDDVAVEYLEKHPDMQRVE